MDLPGVGLRAWIDESHLAQGLPEFRRRAVPLTRPRYDLLVGHGNLSIRSVVQCPPPQELEEPDRFRHPHFQQACQADRFWMLSK